MSAVRRSRLFITHVTQISMSVECNNRKSIFLFSQSLALAGRKCRLSTSKCIYVHKERNKRKEFLNLKRHSFTNKWFTVHIHQPYAVLYHIITQCLTHHSISITDTIIYTQKYDKR